MFNDNTDWKLHWYIGTAHTPFSRGGDESHKHSPLTTLCGRRHEQFLSFDRIQSTVYVLCF